jgi:hypothetical protein
MIAEARCGDQARGEGQPATTHSSAAAPAHRSLRIAGWPRPAVCDATRSVRPARIPQPGGWQLLLLLACVASVSHEERQTTRMDDDQSSAGARSAPPRSCICGKGSSAAAAIEFHATRHSEVQHGRGPARWSLHVNARVRGHCRALPDIVEDRSGAQQCRVRPPEVRSLRRGQVVVRRCGRRAARPPRSTRGCRAAEPRFPVRRGRRGP